MNAMTYQTETVRLTPKEFEALQWVDAQSWINDYADPDNEAQTIEDDELAPEQYAEENAKAKLCRLEPESFTFVRDSSAFRQSTFGLLGAEIPPFDATDAQRSAFRRTVNRLIEKLNITEARQ